MMILKGFYRNGHMAVENVGSGIFDGDGTQQQKCKTFPKLCKKLP